ncbi:hypothetical protein [Solitalea koreensis]|uniref:PepSY domain-containing protein n=1 Tax=Solitalea koreensis TaxID=543615 RepID=A0A521D2R0_9SPHI|nr:hypothetical protein [Solitalea koreensis]SMO65947.1 hypothetical protein SAMN06265350_105203 [Solitalea koreensis]
MIENMEVIPYKISEYIQEHFRDDFLSEIKKVRDLQNVFYEVEITQNNLTYYLRFNEMGTLISEEADPTFPEDDHEGFSTDEGFHPDEIQ